MVESTLNDDESTDTTSQSSETDQETTEQTEEDAKKQEQEEKKKEDEEKEEEFHIHKGKIMGIKPYYQINSVSWDKSYDNPTGTSKTKIAYHKEDFNENNKFIYKGVSCKVKIRRSNEPQFTTTGIEEYGLSEDEIIEREHYPTKEQLEEVGILQSQEDLLTDDPEQSERDKAKEEALETQPYSRSDGDAGLYGFITDVTHEDKGTDLEIKDWGYALEDNTKKLQFDNMFRSQILTEVIKSYGLVPIVDFTGLKDDMISWNNITSGDASSTGGSDSSGGDGQVVGDDAIQIGNSLASMYSFCAGSGSEDYATMKKKKCGSCWAWSDALYTELTKKGYTCRIVQYATAYASNHRSVQIKNGSDWEDYPYRQTDIPKMAYSTDNSKNGKVIVGGD